MNSKLEIIKRYKRKINLLKKHNKLYFNNDNPIISDSEYDDLKKEIIELEKKNNFLKKLDLIKSIVGSPPSNKFKKINHLKPMLSLSNAFDKNEAINCVIKKGQVSFHDTYLLHSSDANISTKPRKAIVLRYMPCSSLFDRNIPDRVSPDGFKYEFQERPIFLVSGNAKENQLKNSNYPV